LNLGSFEDKQLPVVTVQWWEGRTEEQKEKLIKGMAKAFKEIGVNPEWLEIIIYDVPKTNWGSKGQQASKIKS
jgi:4-oxalocrotonate tautomerase